jgi:S1-C subfamily serine protease
MDMSIRRVKVVVLPVDVVIEVDGARVAGSTEFVVALRTNAPGDTVVLTLDDGAEVEVTLDGREEAP